MTAVTDTSVVLNLCLLRQESLLAALFTEVIAPPAVVQEFELLAATDQRFRGLAFPSQIRRVGSTSIIQNLANPARLHSGEIAVISVAVEIGADVVLMDERAGRSAANTLGLKTLGLLGILIAARRRNLVSAVAPLLDRLHHEARFWVAPGLRKAVLDEAGEPASS